MATDQLDVGTNAGLAERARQSDFVVGYDDRLGVVAVPVGDEHVADRGGGRALLWTAIGFCSLSEPKIAALYSGVDIDITLAVQRSRS
jgi:hypothetical protein